jgi:Rad3-related DNA helicase
VVLTFPTPAQLGAGRRYTTWRPGQDDLVVRALASDARAVVLDAPTGTGKSVINFSVASQYARFAYHTSSRALQDQIMVAHGDIGLVDVRGMQNYPCFEMPPKPQNTCDKGPCRDGFACLRQQNGCSYFDRVRAGRAADKVLTNYAMWMTAGGLGARDLLILDEAHEAANAVGSHLRVKLHSVEEDLPIPTPEKARDWSIQTWGVWAEAQLAGVKRELSESGAGTGRYLMLKGLADKLTLLAGASGEWVWEWEEEGLAVTLEPVWPAPYVESMLFKGVPKLLLSSATIRPAHMRYLGLGKGQYEFVSALSPFAPSRRPITWIPTARIGAESEQAELDRWLNRIDEIIGARLGSKGVIHPHSYKLAKFIAAASRHRKHLLFPNRLNLRSEIARFKSMRAPAVLLSPAVKEGVDFAYDHARWQIIAKMPFPPVKASRILQRRVAEDREYQNHLTADALVQMAGRVVRAEDDLGETFIVDDNWSWFRERNEKLFPGWFREALREERGVPASPVF